jgi:alkaline phosphatase
VKTRIGVIGLDGQATDCASSRNSKLDSVLKWAHFAGKSTGIVTTTRVTHATPAGCYAHVFDRDMEAFDGKNFKQEHQDQGCKDIAAQLVDDNANYINVIDLDLKLCLLYI